MNQISIESGRPERPSIVGRIGLWVGLLAILALFANMWWSSHPPSPYTRNQTIRLVSWLAQQHEDDDFLRPLQGHVVRAGVMFFAGVSETSVYEIAGLKPSEVLSRIQLPLLKRGYQREFSLENGPIDGDYFYELMFDRPDGMDVIRMSRLDGSSNVFFNEDFEISDALHRKAVSELGFKPDRSGSIDDTSFLANWRGPALSAEPADAEKGWDSATRPGDEPWVGKLKPFIASSTEARTVYDNQRTYLLKGVGLAKVVSTLAVPLHELGLVRNPYSSSDSDLADPDGNSFAEFGLASLNPRAAALGLVEVIVNRPQNSSDVQITELYGRPEIAGSGAGTPEASGRYGQP